jgi:glycosyltransferase involved in cell wall biosynthesis
VSGEGGLATGAAATATVLVPAHDEARVIGRCLRVLLADALPGEFRVLVVSNGSSDQTADEARRAAADLGYAVEVLELPEPGKVGALRAGLAAVEVWPLIVLDADCELPTASARAIALALQREGPAVASAHLRMATSASSPLVRAYYRTWTALPYARDAMVGSGVFALNEPGWRRLGEFPDVVNDDGWVHRSFAPAERVLVPEPFVAHAARTAGALVSRRARVVNGNRQLSELLGAGSGPTNRRGLVACVRNRQVALPDAAAFLAVTAASRWVAALRRLRGDQSWGMDATSRVPA